MEIKEMKKRIAAAALCAFAAGALAGGRSGRGYLPGAMDWSHLGPCPVELDADGLSLPSEYDLRAAGWVSPAKAQGPYGCCWAFAACGALESSVMRRYGGLAADFSERNMALFDGRDHDPSVDMHGFGSIDAGGSQSDAEAYLMRWAGPVEESADPYPSGASPAFDALAAKYGGFFSDSCSAELTLEYVSGLSFDDWTFIDRMANTAGHGHNFRTNFIATAKAVGASGKAEYVPHVRRELVPDEAFADCEGRQGPWKESFHVQASWRIPARRDALDNAAIKYAVVQNGAVVSPYMPDGEVLVIGWNDSYSASNFPEGARPEGDGAFLVQTSWGDGEPVWISYYDEGFARGPDGTSCVYTRVDDPYSPENYDMIHGYDVLGLRAGAGIGKADATAACMFVAEGAESIRAVGTYLVQWNTEYTVSVYTGCSAGKPTSGILAWRQSGTRLFPGFETIDLGASVPVAAGERYSVVVAFRTPGCRLPVPMQVDDTASARHSKKGVSYMKDAKGVWTDTVAAYNPKKAFTAANSPKTFCCKVYADARVAESFDADAKGVYRSTLSDGSVLTVTVGTASGGTSQVSAKIVKGSKTVATFAARGVPTSDGEVILKGSAGKDLRLSIAGSEEGGNEVSATLGGTELDVKSLVPNVTGYDVGLFRVGVAASGVPAFENGTGRALSWSASGLPSGVSINAKTGVLRGSPTKAVRSARARVVATAEDGGSDAFEFDYAVDAMDSWVKGAKSGGGEASALSFTAGSTGKISGKLLAAGSTWTFSGACFSSYSESDDGGHYLWKGKAVRGKASVPVELDVHLSVLTNCTKEATVSEISVAEFSSEALGSAEAYASVWGLSPYSAYAKPIAAAPSIRLAAPELDCLRDSEKLTLKFGAGGAVTAVGSFRHTSGGKTTSFSKSFSTTLVPVSSGEDGAFRGDAFVFFPSDSKVKFSGFARRIALEWDNFFFRLR